MAAASPLTHPILHPPAPISRRALRRLRGALLGALLLAVIPAGVLSLAEVLPRLSATGTPVVSEAHRAALARARVLPVEWRWSPASVDVDRMYRRAR